MLKDCYSKIVELEKLAMSKQTAQQTLENVYKGIDEDVQNFTDKDSIKLEIRRRILVLETEYIEICKEIDRVNLMISDLYSK